MPEVDRAKFLRDGYLILRGIVPPNELAPLRASYETLLDRQRKIWADERGPDDPPGGQWDTVAQPRIMHTENLVDADTAGAVELWLSDRTRGVADQLLSLPQAAVAQMMLMANPTRDHGPANWHRDVHPIDMGPMRSMQAALAERGPTYIQWNIPLYDDRVLWVVPGSHTRLNTDEENRALSEDPRVPLPGGIPVELEAGDAVVYINYFLHWGSDYSAQPHRRTIHGGHTIFTSWEQGDLGFTRHLSPESRERFEGWAARADELKDTTERCLRAVLDGDRAAYVEGLEALHPGAGPAGKLQLTIWLCKAAMHIQLLKRPHDEVMTDGLHSRPHRPHPITLNWGPAFAERFTKVEADAIWPRFAPLEAVLTAADGEDFVPGYQSGQIPYYVEEMPDPITFDEFLATWNGSG